MFRQFATFVTPTALFNAHPAELMWMLERAWDQRFTVSTATLGSPDNRSGLATALPPSSEGAPISSPLLRTVETSTFDSTGEPVVRSYRWDHLIYAYMIENTRIYEVFRRVVHELVHGEKLGAPTQRVQNWLRNTEELFFKDGAPFFTTSLASHVRPGLRENRRNPYQRMFGMELNHGSDDGKPLTYVRAEAANNEFVPTFEEFLREVWVGMSYVTATASSNPTDPAKIHTLVSKLKNMLMSRRLDGTLSREEYSAVTAMSWFHLTVEVADSPVVDALLARADGTEQRLFKIAERVGLPAHGLSKHFFDIADAISRILITIERGDYDAVDAIPALYTRSPATPTSPESAMRTIITHWTAITGRDVKARKVTPN